MEATTFLYTSIFPQFPVAFDDFIIENFVDLPNNDAIIADATSKSVTLDSCNSSSFSAFDPSVVDTISPTNTISSVLSDINFTGDLCVPCDDIPELERLLNIDEESYTSEELKKMELVVSYLKGQNNGTLVTWPKISDVKERNDSASKTMWEVKLVSDVREQNDNALVDVQEMEAQNHDESDTMQNMELIFGVDAQIKYASQIVQKMEMMISCKKRPNDDDVSEEEAHQFHSVPNQNNLMSKSNTQVFVPAKSRSKRPRGPPADWTSRLLLLSSTTTSPELDPMPKPKLELGLELEPEQRHEFLIPTLNSSFIGVSSKKPTKPACRRKDNNDGGSGGDSRRCLHCATDKTPQWRTGPMGLKTLCNACGVRYKSGRLVPEYRPASSPTFVMAKHSNSHRKVLELRRQKELVQVPHHHHHQQHENFQHHHRPNVIFHKDISNGDE